MRAALLMTMMLAAAPPDRTGIQVGHAWTRATGVGQADASAYITITSVAGDTILGVGTMAAASAVLRQVLIKGGQVSRRTRVEGLLIGSNQTVAMHPGGLDIMLLGLKAPLVVGTRIVLELSFRRAGVIDVIVPVLASDAADPAP